MSKLTAKLFVYLTLSACLAYLLLSFLTAFNQNVSPSNINQLTTRLTESLYPSSVIELNDTAFDKYCDEHGEWETIGRKVFFKRSAVFYFIDLNLLRIHAILRPRVQIRLVVTIAASDETRRVSIDIKTMNVTSKWNVEEYDFVTIDCKFNISEHLEVKQVAKLGIHIRIRETQLNGATVNDLVVRVKYTNNQSELKGSAMICGKCFHMKKSSDFLMLGWWIELNKQIGYERIFICNHSIENDSAFEKLFSRYERFLRVGKLECLPDLRTFKKKYHKSYLELVDKNKKFNIYKYDVVNQLIQNECYLEHIDQYRHVTIEDVDETVIPSSFSEGKCTSYRLESYLKYLLKSQNITNPSTLYFQNALYLQNSLIRSLHDSFGQILANMSGLNVTTYDFELKAKEINERDPTRKYILVFSIKSRAEFEYASHLFQVYKNKIEPFLLENQQRISQVAQHFDRFFFLISRLNYFGAGKSIHSTISTFDASMHHAVTFMQNKTLHIDNLFTVPEKAHYFAVPYDVAWVSHFRKRMNFAGQSELQEFSIYSLHVDLNYFHCYFLPIFNSSQVG
jgi:hypothetical protein